MVTQPTLTDRPTLGELQLYVSAVGKLRGFDTETLHEEFTMLVEEVGELAKAIRKRHGTMVATDSKIGVVEHEAADVLWLLLTVCNSLNIDLETALREKDAINQQRVWQ